MLRRSHLILMLCLSLPINDRLTGDEVVGGRVIDDAIADRVTIRDAAINESSGLAFSHRRSNSVWTHNDSGDTARLFCIDCTDGRLTGGCELVGATAIDWEAMTSVPPSLPMNRRPRLIVADSGDNNRIRDSISLYRFDEPAPDEMTKLNDGQYERLDIRFQGQTLLGISQPTKVSQSQKTVDCESINCEAIWFDPDEQQVVLVAKSTLPIAGVYAVPLDAWSTPDPKTPVVAQRIATLAVPLVTGGDRDPNTGDVWLVSYWQAFCFRRDNDDNLTSQLAKVPEVFSLPKWKQIEAISVDHDSRVWITTERTPAFLGRLKFGRLKLDQLKLDRLKLAPSLND